MNKGIQMGGKIPPYKFTRPDDSEFRTRLAGFDISFTEYVNTVSYVKDVSYDYIDIHEMIEQVEKRREYHYIFHNMPQGLSEAKVLAAYCYWILKLRPIRFEFRDKTEDEKNNADDGRKYDEAYFYFTERFCLHMLEELCLFLKDRNLNLTPYRRAELEYTLKHTDVTKGALMIIFEILIDNS